ncbi:MAG: DUF2029 domain-containing protein [Bacteroidales bacterium]|nr:DUF2029 domain-containing protein [Bacteroidales bacterium]
MLRSKIELLLKNPQWILVVYVLFAIAASLQDYFLTKTATESMGFYTHYNNYMIFKHSFFNLLSGENLYIHHYDRYIDLFKYSPAFALFFGGLAVLPDWLGLILWNVLNAVVLMWALYLVFPKDKKSTSILLLLVLIEALTSFQTHQSNGLMAGLIILGWRAMERQNLLAAAGFLMATVFIKIFGIVAFVMFLFYPNKLKSLAFSLVWFLILFFIPLVATNPETLWTQYENWGIMLANDHSASYGISVMGWLNSWFGLSQGKNVVLALGTAALIAPLIRFSEWKSQHFRLLYLSSLLIWVIIFNHKAESPTFVIAIAGAAIWFLLSRKNTFDILLIVVAVVFTSLSPSDIFPKMIRTDFFQPFVIKVIPMILIWIKINYELLTSTNLQQLTVEHSIIQDDTNIFP